MEILPRYVCFDFPLFFFLKIPNFLHHRSALKTIQALIGPAVKVLVKMLPLWITPAMVEINIPIIIHHSLVHVSIVNKKGTLVEIVPRNEKSFVKNAIKKDICDVNVHNYRQ